MNKVISYGHQSIDSTDIGEVMKVLRSDWLTQGPKVCEFEKALCDYTGAKFSVAVSSGTAALHLACMASGLRPEDEVVTSPITFIASANCVLYCGAKPVFADILEKRANIDPEEIKEKVTRRTRCIIPVHFAGYPCDMKDISDIALKYRLTVIEDAAHALGASYKYRGKWVKVGSCLHSDMAAFSFHPVKSITTGEGGAVTTNSKVLYKKLISLRSHGIEKTSCMARKHGPWYYEMRNLGFNYRITDIQCALGISQLRRIDKFITKRREIAKIYDDRLSGIGDIMLPELSGNARSARHLYYIRVKSIRSAFDRMRIVNRLKYDGVGSQVHYIPVYFHPYYRRLGFKKGICPNAESYYRNAITIPLHYLMSDDDLEHVVRAVKRCV